MKAASPFERLFPDERQLLDSLTQPPKASGTRNVGISLPRVFPIHEKFIRAVANHRMRHSTQRITIRRNLKSSQVRRGTCGSIIKRYVQFGGILITQRAATGNARLPVPVTVTDIYPSSFALLRDFLRDSVCRHLACTLKGILTAPRRTHGERMRAWQDFSSYVPRQVPPFDLSKAGPPTYPT